MSFSLHPRQRDTTETVVRRKKNPEYVSDRKFVGEKKMSREVEIFLQQIEATKRVITQNKKHGRHSRTGYHNRKVTVWA